MFPTTRSTLVSAVLVVAAAAPLHAGVRVQLEAQGNGTSSFSLDHPFLNNNPGALLIVGPRDFNGGMVDVYFDAVRWRITGNGAPIPSDAHFWVLAFDTDSGFRHLTTGANTTDHVTSLDHPRLNGNPNARPIVTREASTGTPVPWPVGTWYDSDHGRWTIFYQNTTRDMPVGATFSVFIPDDDEQSYIHTATGGNVTSNYTIFNSAAIDQTAPHRIFATQRWIGTYNDHEIAVAWLFSFLIGNVDGAAMPVGAAFNVYVAPIFEDGFELGSDVLWSDSVP